MGYDPTRVALGIQPSMRQSTRVPEAWQREGIMWNLTRLECSVCAMNLEVASVETHINSKPHKKNLAAAGIANEFNGKLWVEPHWYSQGIYYNASQQLECYYCSVPLTINTVRAHVEGRAHAKKTQMSVLELTPELAAEGITIGNGHLLCELCAAGPFSVEVAHSHVMGVKHQKKRKQATMVVPPDLEHNGIRWEECRFHCTPCGQALGTLEHATKHITGNKHLRAILAWADRSKHRFGHRCTSNPTQDQLSDSAEKELSREECASNPTNVQFSDSAEKELSRDECASNPTNDQFDSAEKELSRDDSDFPLCISVFDGSYWCDHCAVKVVDIHKHVKQPQHRKKEQSGWQLSELRYPPCCSYLRLRCNVCDKFYETRKELLQHLGSKDHGNMLQEGLVGVRKWEWDAKLGILRDGTGRQYLRNGHFELPWAGPLPPGWRGDVDEATGKEFYYHARAKFSTYEDPRNNPVLASME